MGMRTYHGYLYAVGYLMSMVGEWPRGNHIYTLAREQKYLDAGILDRR